MGQLIRGQWVTDLQMKNTDTSGRFVNNDGDGFHNWITSNGTPGPTGSGNFAVEPERYHLYVSYACPWAQRTLIMRNLKGLQAFFSVSVVDAIYEQDGWTLSSGTDPVNNTRYLRDIYIKAKSDYTGKVAVPVLWDKKLHTIVSNDSAEIILMMNSDFHHHGKNDTDYYPLAQRDQINEIDERLYNGYIIAVYHAGFATSQLAYDTAVKKVFQTLEWLEQHLDGRDFLVGDHLTVADIKAFTSLIRFDLVYHGHFKCNWKRLTDFNNIPNYLRRIYQMPGVVQTIDWKQITKHYYGSHIDVNPTGIVPIGSSMEWLTR